MSLELVSKCLELEDLTVKGESSKGSKGKKSKKFKSNNAMEMIPTTRHGIWKELRKVRQKQQREIKKKKKAEIFKSAMEVYKETHDIDHTDRNVKALLKISKLGKVDTKCAEKILYHLPCRLSRDIKPGTEVSEPTTVFTEDDFEAFARDYQPKKKLPGLEHSLDDDSPFSFGS